MTRKQPDYTLHDYTRSVVQHFLEELAQPPVNLHEFVMKQVESALLMEVLRYSKGNLTKSAQYLGVNRATLRKKLKAHHLTPTAMSD